MTNPAVLHMSQIDFKSTIGSENPWVNVENIVGIKQMHIVKYNLQNKKNSTMVNKLFKCDS